MPHCERVAEAVCKQLHSSDPELRQPYTHLLLDEVVVGEDWPEPPQAILSIPIRQFSLLFGGGAPDSDAAWQEALKPIRNAGGQRTLYLDRTQRQALLRELDTDAAAFVRALCLLPMRAGAIAELNVGDFDQATGELSIKRDKSAKPRRILLPDDAASLMAQQAENKLPNAPLFMRSNGKRWDKNSWKKPISSAAKKANLPDGVIAYTLRHSTITDLVNSGLALLPVAQISGTSIEMIEKHYGHLDRLAAKQALASLTL